MLLWNVHFDNCKREWGPKNPGGSQFILREIGRMAWDCDPAQVLKEKKENEQKHLSDADVRLGFSLWYIVAPTKEKAIQKALEWASTHTNVGPIDVRLPNYDHYGRPLMTREDYAEKHQKKLQRKQNKHRKRNNIHIPMLSEDKVLSASIVNCYQVLLKRYYHEDGEAYEITPEVWKTFPTETDAKNIVSRMVADYRTLYTALAVAKKANDIPKYYYDYEERHEGVVDSLGKKIFKQFNQRYANVLDLTDNGHYYQLGVKTLKETLSIQKIALYKFR